MIKWDKIWHFKHVWSNLSNLKKKSSPPSIALSIQKQEVNLVLPWICKVNYPKRSSYIMRDKLIIRSNFYTNWYQFQDFIRVVQLTQSLSPQVCAGGYLHHQVQLIDHAKPMPKGNQRLKTMISHPLQSSSSPLSAIGSCLDTLTWDNADPPRSFHVTLS